MALHAYQLEKLPDKKSLLKGFAISSVRFSWASQAGMKIDSKIIRKETLSFYNSSNTNTMFDEPYHNFVRRFFLFRYFATTRKENPRKRNGEGKVILQQQQDFSISRFYFRMKQAIFLARWNRCENMKNMISK